MPCSRVFRFGKHARTRVDNQIYAKNFGFRCVALLSARIFRAEQIYAEKYQSVEDKTISVGVPCDCDTGTRHESTEHSRHHVRRSLWLLCLQCTKKDNDKLEHVCCLAASFGIGRRVMRTCIIHRIQWNFLFVLLALCSRSRAPSNKQFSPKSVWCMHSVARDGGSYLAFIEPELSFPRTFCAKIMSCIFRRINWSDLIASIHRPTNRPCRFPFCVTHSKCENVKSVACSFSCESVHAALAAII